VKTKPKRKSPTAAQQTQARPKRSASSTSQATKKGNGKPKASARQEKHFDPHNLLNPIVIMSKAECKAIPTQKKRKSYADFVMLQSEDAVNAALAKASVSKKLYSDSRSILLKRIDLIIALQATTSSTCRTYG
jgi:hypothetical protein